MIFVTEPLQKLKLASNKDSANTILKQVIFIFFPFENNHKCARQDSDKLEFIS